MWKFICDQALIYKITNNLPQSELESEFTESGCLHNYSLVNANFC